MAISSFEAQEEEYIPSSRGENFNIQYPELQKKKWPYFGSQATNKKNKDTFFSSTFKV